MRNHPVYSTVVAGTFRVDLIEREPGGESIRRLEVWTRAQLIGRIDLLASVFPSFSVSVRDHGARMVIWTESVSYLLELASGVLTRYEHSDAIQAVYAVEGSWCLVGDASIALVDLERATEIKRYDHDEILLSARWEGADLVVDDLGGRTIRFGFSPADSMSLHKL